ncbi:MAG: TPM domain-containing protein [Planctomycetota bacterium]
MQEQSIRRRAWPVIGWLAWSLATVALADGPATIDGPRPPGHVVDAVGLLGADDVAAIERLAAGIEAAAGGDLVVVVIRTTGERPHRAFATELFNRWQLGSAERNDGLLIFVALDDRKAEIVLGDGLDDPLQMKASQQIMDNVLIPEFKAGRPAAGLRKAALACGTQILSAAEAQVEDGPPKPGPEAEPFSPTPADAAPLPAFRSPPRQPQSGGLIPLALMGGCTVGGTGLSWYLVRRHLRNRPRQCPECRIDMIRLGEQADNSHLAAGQQKEEQLHSVDYDVWTCPTCPHVTKLRYDAFFTSLSKCSGCGFKTESNTVNRVRAPTKWRSGLETITEHCKHCGRAETTSRDIPQLSDDSDSSFFSSSSSGSDSSFSSSSGGSSSGSGASGSW